MHDVTWLPHPFYTSYEVSDDGRIRSIDRITEVRMPKGGSYSRFTRGKELTLHFNPHNGYLMTALRVRGEHINVSLHRMVCEAFHGMPTSPKLEARHINGIKTDCRPENLEWGTRQQNILDRQRHGADYQLNKTHCPRGHEYTPANTYIPPGKRSSRVCRACTRRNQLAAYYRRKEAQKCSS